MCDVCVMVVEKKREEREKGETKIESARAREEQRSQTRYTYVPTMVDVDRCLTNLSST